jgi:flagellar export protein FliJ
MDAITTLIKAARHRVDDAQLALAAVEGKRAGNVRAQSNLEEELIAEKVEANGVAAAAIGPFVQRKSAERRRLLEEAARLTQTAAAIRGDLAEAFLELKKLETLAEQAAARARLAAERREQAALDEANVLAAARKRG